MQAAMRKGEAQLLVQAGEQEEATVGREEAAGEVDLERFARQQRKRHGVLRTGHGRDGSFLGVRSITQRTVRRESGTSLPHLPSFGDAECSHFRHVVNYLG
jgi:hypothetical protein